MIRLLPVMTDPLLAVCRIILRFCLSLMFVLLFPFFLIFPDSLVSERYADTDQIASPHISLFFKILIDTNMEMAYIATTKITADSMSRTGKWMTAESSLPSPAGSLAMSSSVAKNPATGMYMNTLPLIEPSL